MVLKTRMGRNKGTRRKTKMDRPGRLKKASLVHLDLAFRSEKHIIKDGKCSCGFVMEWQSGD